MITPTTKEEGIIFFGRSGLNILLEYGISSTEYLKIHGNLVEHGLRTKCPDAITQITFALYCHELLKMNFNIENLITEFNLAQKSDFSEISHVVSLAKLCFHYKKANFAICVNKKSNSKSPDLTIDGVKCDLKVRLDQIDRRMQPYKDSLMVNGNSKEYNDRYFKEIRTMSEDLQSALRNRSGSGFQQAECLIFDLSSHFHTWNFHRLKNSNIEGISNKPIKPIPGYVIIFSPNNAMSGGAKFDPEAIWGYILWDVQKGEFK